MSKCSIGGQAVMEGVMMQSEYGTAIVVRRPDGSLCKEYRRKKKRYKKGSFPTWPFVRGVYALVQSLTNGMDITTRSAELLGEEFEEEPSKFEKWLSKKTDKSLMEIVKVVAIVLALLLAVALFVLLPIGIVTGIEALGALFGIPWIAEMNLSVSTILQGLIRLGIFLLYLYLISKMKDIKRVYMYHGAEHKTIACYEADMELTPENAAKCTRFHARCGTNYLFLTMAVSILVTTIFTALMELVPGFTEWQSVGINKFLFRILRILLIPLIAGVSYEVLKLAAKKDNWISRVVRAPGLALQSFTTLEPTLDMLEVAIASFELAMNPPKHDIIVDVNKEREQARAKQEQAAQAKAASVEQEGAAADEPTEETREEHSES